MSDAAWHGLIQFPTISGDDPFDVLTGISMISNAQHLAASGAQFRINWMGRDHADERLSITPDTDYAYGATFGPFPVQRKADGNTYDWRCDAFAYTASGGVDLAILLSPTPHAANVALMSDPLAPICEIGTATTTKQNISSLAAFDGFEQYWTQAGVRAATSPDGEAFDVCFMYAILAARINASSPGAAVTVCGLHLSEYVIP